jgi:hypothetical protein
MEFSIGERGFGGDGMERRGPVRSGRQQRQARLKKESVRDARRRSLGGRSDPI